MASFPHYKPWQYATSGGVLYKNINYIITFNLLVNDLISNYTIYIKDTTTLRIQDDGCLKIKVGYPMDHYNPERDHTILMFRRPDVKWGFNFKMNFEDNVECVDLCGFTPNFKCLGYDEKKGMIVIKLLTKEELRLIKLELI